MEELKEISREIVIMSGREVTVVQSAPILTPEELESRQKATNRLLYRIGYAQALRRMEAEKAETAEQRG